MRKTLGAALVAGAIFFAGCGGDSDTTPRAFETEGPAEASLDRVEPLVQKINDALDRLAERNEIVEDSKDLVEALESNTFDEGRYAVIRRLARTTDRLVTDLFGDGSLVVRAREIADDMTEYVAGEFDDGTVGRLVDSTQDLSETVEEIMDNNAYESLRRTTSRLMPMLEEAAERVSDTEIAEKAVTLIHRIDKVTEDAVDTDGTIYEVSQLTADLLNALEELIRP